MFTNIFFIMDLLPETQCVILAFNVYSWIISLGEVAVCNNVYFIIEEVLGPLLWTSCGESNHTVPIHSKLFI